MKPIKSIKINGREANCLKMGGGMMWRKGEYEEVEWLESHGKEWIETGIMPDNNTGMMCELMVYNTNAYVVMGGRGADNNTRFCINPSSQYVFLSWGQGYNTCANTVNKRQQVYMNYLNDRHRIANGVHYNDVSGSIEVTEQYTIPIFAGKWSSPNAAVMLNGRVYIAQITHYDKMIGDYHPCRRLSDGELGMYDTIGKVFYTNQGTGTFTAGAKTGRYY